MTNYVFHYDLENPDRCVKAAPILADLHRQRGIPATFFLLGSVLEQKAAELKGIFGDDPLFDLQSHTWTHRRLRDNVMHGAGVGLDDLREEIRVGRQLVEDTFQRPCAGVRSGCGFFRGFQGEPERLGIIWEEGTRFFSSDLRGPVDSIPSGLQQAYWYDKEGFPELLELPGHGWHDNVLKDPAGHGQHWLCRAWPPVVPWGIPNRPTRTPEEEIVVQRVWLDRAVAQNLDYVSLVYHPHSILSLSPDCRIMKLLMDHVEESGLPTTTYHGLYERYSAAPKSVPGREAWKWGGAEEEALRLPEG
ncbi:MAG: hypothetical protein COZ06_13925 [Armatimonadetes bacterium CG_4_10_14_3_um_filter_66_18]|nr:polysaccharide deacetylase family protein [Armatimonadota bacterium]OIO97149.1 MAG: hypothetical protein AUJ96_23710 [Armatimonadetes bacterium CG2_30_66_41]PIU90641.1 MAG: hypothetical protein COS65_24540 [Armatimonadetes bacterium CG06_land_8_20_14_3_00_66_21]PIX47767.1 MAG: hypothetical protein COZ57_07545 [Armatimonadetes bacterium CG_4_8_14_3_um_filter_66_20]PIY49511.1 MAG: hypothetical protein COZ06_13925 [Armatimonadetes bacterium CG_4_10_14_3_um_filter_66_18]PIZ45312.1 MAG: hypothet